MSDPSPEVVVDALLRRLLSRYGGRQIFLFGPEGEPFLAARLPVERVELADLERGLDLIVRLEPSRPKPFLAFDPERRVLVAAIGGAPELYVVVVLAEDDPLAGVAAEAPDPPGPELAARVELLRREILPYANEVRLEMQRRVR